MFKINPIKVPGSNHKQYHNANRRGDLFSSSLSAPLTSLSFFCVSQCRRQMEGAPACGTGKKEMSILISCLEYTLSVSITSISPSCWICCGGNAATPVSDVLLVPSGFIFTIKDMLQMTKKRPCTSQVVC